MFIIYNNEDISKNLGSNKILGTNLKIKNSKIIFKGSNNFLYCDESITLQDCNLNFAGDNSIIFLSNSVHPYRLNVLINNNSVLYFGSNNFFNTQSIVTIYLSEEKHFFCGNNGMFSTGIFFRNADPHLIYDSKTYKRLNKTKSIYLGDHVWIGQNSLILKGTKIDSGSIIGGGSVISGKHISHNTVWAGNPVKLIKKNIFWDGACVHDWNDEQTLLSQSYLNYCKKKNRLNYKIWIYEYNKSESLNFETLESIFSGRNVSEKLNYLKLIKQSKNRFVHK